MFIYKPGSTIKVGPVVGIIKAAYMYAGGSVTYAIGYFDEGTYKDITVNHKEIEYTHTNTEIPVGFITPQS